jgi:hypothetical protein
MYDVDVIYMLIMQRCQRMEEKQQRLDQYNMVWEWEARERERDLYPRPSTTATRLLLRNVGLLKYYEEATSLKGNSAFLAQLIHRWDAHQQAFRVGPHQWYHPTEEDIYFITGLSRRGEDFPQFLDVPVGVAAESQLAYSQRYIARDIPSPGDFQVAGGQLQITSFGAEDVRCLSLLLSTISHFIGDGQCISCTLLYYVDSLIQRP